MGPGSLHSWPDTTTGFAESIVRPSNSERLCSTISAERRTTPRAGHRPRPRHSLDQLTHQIGLRVRVVPDILVDLNPVLVKARVEFAGKISQAAEPQTAVDLSHNATNNPHTRRITAVVTSRSEKRREIKITR